MSYPVEETLTCVNCGAVYSLEIIEEGDKATEPLIEFCPVCVCITTKLKANR